MFSERIKKKKRRKKRKKEKNKKKEQKRTKEKWPSSPSFALKKVGGPSN